MNNEVKRIHTPLDDEVIKSLKPGDMVLLSGKIYCGRDAVLPKVCKLIKENKLGDTDINLIGNVIFHTAVSPAGVGPTLKVVFHCCLRRELKCIWERVPLEKKQ